MAVVILNGSGIFSLKAMQESMIISPYKPDLTAGWVSIYDWWAYTRKSIKPDEIYINISSIPEDERDNYEFHEISNPYDNSVWLYKYLVDNHIAMDAIIVYYFDC